MLDLGKVLTGFVGNVCVSLESEELELEMFELIYNSDAWRSDGSI